MSVFVMVAMFPKSKNKDETIAKHSQGHLFLVLKKCTFFAASTVAPPLEFGSSNVQYLGVKELL